MKRKAKSKYSTPPPPQKKKAATTKTKRTRLENKSAKIKMKTITRKLFLLYEYSDLHAVEW